MKKFQCIFIVIYFLYNSLEANDNLNNVLYNNNHLFTKTILDCPQECKDKLEQFATSAAKFTLCSITNSRPIRLCANCINEYVNFTGTFKGLDEVVNGTPCRSFFISQDRFDVVLEYYNHIMTLWSKGHCNDCFEFSGGTAQLSNNTIQFNKMAQDTLDCIETHRKPNNSDEACVACMQLYIKLNDFYGTLSKDSIGVDSVCMDTVDTMNTTRSIWSHDLNCCKMRKSPETVFLCCTAIISLLPFLYYIIVRYCGPIRDLPNVLKESRFKQSFLRSMRERVN